MFKYLLFLAAILPFQVALNPAEGVDLASIRVLILILFFAWLAESLKNKSLQIKKHWTTGLAISFLFLNLISILAARNTDWSARKLLFLFSVFPLFFAAQAIIDDPKKAEKIGKVLVFGGTAVSFLGIFQFFSQFIFGLEKVYRFWAENLITIFLGKTFSQAVLQNPSWLVNISGHTFLRATATFPDPHMLSFFLGMLIPIAAFFFLTEEKKVYYGGCLSAMLICDLATFSRGGYLGILAGGIFFTFYFWKKISRKAKFAIAGASLIFLILLATPNPFAQRYASILNLNEGSNKGRIEIWRQAIQVIEKNPIIGTGIGNYPLAIKPTADYREPIYAHNAYLDIAVETGILGALIWIAFIGLAIRSFLIISKKYLFFAAPAASLVVFSVHSLVETPIYSPVILATFLLMISFSGLERIKENEKIHNPV